MSKKNNKLNNISKINSNTKTKMATPEQVETINEFVKSYSLSLKSSVEQSQLLAKISASNGMYQPILSEQILQQINFNPQSATSQNIEQWLLHPQQNDIQLRGLSQYLEYAVGEYQKLIHYYTDMLSFNYMVLPCNNNGNVDKNKKTMLNSYHKACDMVQKMNIKNTFNGMALTTMQDGVSYWLRVDTLDKISFLPIPTDYCRIVSKWDRGWKGEVNLAYFDRMYGLAECLPELYEAYELFLQKRKEGLQGVKLAPYQYFPLPIEKTWIFNFDQNKAVKIPPLSSSMESSLDIISYRNLLKDQSFIDLWKIFALKIPQKRNGDQLIMSYEEAADIISMIQSTLPDNMNVFASPFEVEPVNTNQISSLDKTIDMANNSFYSGAGVSGTFFGMDTKSAKALQISQTKDFLFSSVPLYAQFNNMVNWFLDLEFPTYRWKVKFSGNKINEQEEINTALKLTTTANFPVSYLASTVGFEPCEFEGLVDIENSLGLKDKLKPLVSAFQSSKVSQDVGKPKQDMNTITSEGLETRDSRGDV